MVDLVDQVMTDHPEGRKLVVDTLTPALDRVVGYKSLWRKVLSLDPDWNPPQPDMTVNMSFPVAEDGNIVFIEQIADNLGHRQQPSSRHAR